MTTMTTIYCVCRETLCGGIDCNLGDDLEDARNVICTGFTDITKA